MNTESPSLRVLIPYFGQWPFWMPLFLRSCELNPGVTWVLFTDCGRPLHCPSNVEIRETSFQDYCQRVSSRLNIAFAPTEPYKLCDLKPTLGHVHEDELEDCSHWAFGDIDLVYGRLEAYLASRDLKRFDVISLHARRLSGHLTVLRNSPDMNGAFRRVKDWAAALESPMHCAFDEKAFSKVFLRHKNSPSWVRGFAALLDPWLTRADFEEAYTTPNAKIPWRDGSNDFPKEWYWQNGRVWNDRDREHCYPYLHFMNWKKHWAADQRFEVSQVCSNDALWTFTESGIQLSKD